MRKPACWADYGDDAAWADKLAATVEVVENSLTATIEEWLAE